MTSDGKVYRRLAKHYPPHVIQWVKGLDWKKRDVPLTKIHMQPRPGHPHDPVKVAGIRRAMRAGKPMAPVVLVNTGKGDAKIADGYHRLKAAELEGRSHHVALIATKRQRTGPWSRAMHDAKLNR